MRRTLLEVKTQSLKKVVFRIFMYFRSISVRGGIDDNTMACLCNRRRRNRPLSASKTRRIRSTNVFRMRTDHKMGTATLGATHMNIRILVQTVAARPLVAMIFTYMPVKSMTTSSSPFFQRHFPCRSLQTNYGGDSHCGNPLSTNGSITTLSYTCDLWFATLSVYFSRCYQLFHTSL